MFRNANYNSIINYFIYLKGFSIHNVKGKSNILGKKRFSHNFWYFVTILCILHKVIRQSSLP